MLSLHKRSNSQFEPIPMVLAQILYINLYWQAAASTSMRMGCMEKRCRLTARKWGQQRDNGVKNKINFLSDTTFKQREEA